MNEIKDLCLLMDVDFMHVLQHANEVVGLPAKQRVERNVLYVEPVVWIFSLILFCLLSLVLLVFGGHSSYTSKLCLMKVFHY